MDDLSDLEHRIDHLEAWQLAEAEVKKAQAEATQARHTRLQIFLAVVSSLTMLVNLYLTLTHGK